MQKSYAIGMINLKLLINKPYKPLDLYKSFIDHKKNNPNTNIKQNIQIAGLLFT